MMKELKFRPLEADELEARVATVSDKGCSVLIYKNARVDMNILDETVGQFNWQRDHKEVKGRMYCGIGIWDDEKSTWIWKWDCGTESNTEAEKGEASDSFKRAGFNWGIGRELYTAPFIWFNAGDVRLQDRGGRKTTYDRFQVDEIQCVDGRIVKLIVSNKSTGARFIHTVNATITSQHAREIKMMLEESGTDVKAFLGYYKARSVDEMTELQYVEACKILNERMQKRGA